MEIIKKPLVIGLSTILALVFAFPVQAADEVFTDLNDSWAYFEEVLALGEAGIFEGYEDGSFQGYTNINRAELAKVLTTAKGLTLEEIETAVDEYVAEVGWEEASFTDVTAVVSNRDSNWYVDYVIYGKSQGWWSGYEDGSFGPGEWVSTMETIKMVVESQWGTPSSYYEGELWYHRYSNLLEAFNVISVFNSSSEDYVKFTYNTYGYTMKWNSSIDRNDVAKLLYIVMSVMEEGEGSWVTFNDPEEMTLSEYAETYDAILEAGEDSFSVYDDYFGFQLENVPLGEYAIEDIILHLKNPSGFDHGFYTRWSLQYPNDYYLFAIEIVEDELSDSCYFTDERFDFYDDVCTEENTLQEALNFGSYSTETE